MINIKEYDVEYNFMKDSNNFSNHNDDIKSYLNFIKTRTPLSLISRQFELHSIYNLLVYRIKLNNTFCHQIYLNRFIQLIVIEIDYVIKKYIDDQPQEFTRTSSLLNIFKKVVESSQFDNASIYYYDQTLYNTFLVSLNIDQIYIS